MRSKTSQGEPVDVITLEEFMELLPNASDVPYTEGLEYRHAWYQCPKCKRLIMQPTFCTGAGHLCPKSKNSTGGNGAIVELHRVVVEGDKVLSAYGERVTRDRKLTPADEAMLRSMLSKTKLRLGLGRSRRAHRP